MDLNQRPADYESVALPLKLQQRIAGLSRLPGKFDKQSMCHFGFVLLEKKGNPTRLRCETGSRPASLIFGHYQYSRRFPKNRPVFFPTLRFYLAIQRQRKTP